MGIDALGGYGLVAGNPFSFSESADEIEVTSSIGFYQDFGLYDYKDDYMADWVDWAKRFPEFEGWDYDDILYYMEDNGFPYDFQRDDLYDWEQKAVFSNPNLKEYSDKEVKQFVKKWSKQFGVREPVLRKVQYLLDDSGYVGEYLITVGRRGAIGIDNSHVDRKDLLGVVAHEFAHHVVDEWTKGPFESAHGGLFVGVYTRILEQEGILPNATQLAMTAGLDVTAQRPKPFGL